MGSMKAEVSFITRRTSVACELPCGSYISFSGHQARWNRGRVRHGCFLSVSVEKIERKGQSSEDRHSRQSESAHDNAQRHTWFVVNGCLARNAIAPVLHHLLLQSRSTADGLFTVPPSTDGSQKTPWWDRRRAYSCSDELLKWLLGRLPRIEYSLLEACQRQRVLFWIILIVCSDIFNRYIF